MPETYQENPELPVVEFDEVLADLAEEALDALEPRVGLLTHLLETAAPIDPWGGNYLRWDAYHDMRAFGWSHKKLRRLVMDPRTNVKLEDRK